MPTQIELVKELSADSDTWQKKYPWFSLGQLIDASNRKQQTGLQAPEQTTAIFFNDIHRLHWLLNEQTFNKNKILNDLSVPVNTESMQATPQPFPKKEHPPIITEAAQLIAAAAVEENDAIPNLIEQHNKIALVDDVVVHSMETQKTIEETPEIDEDEDIIIDSPDVTSKAILPAKPILETEIKQDNTVQVHTTEINSDDVLPVNQPVAIEKEVVAATSTENGGEKNEIEEKNEAINAGLSAEKIKQSLDDGDKAMELSFEPYHTIDYFASQGIKVDAKADDRLGKQLKSFTSWLKSMKRLPTAEEVPTEAVVVQIQDKSLENTNVITEAMAAVLVKQGKKEQAIEIFRQLSLLHPEKSRYFAAQIEQIKN